MADLGGDGLDGLHAGGAGADHGDALAGEIDRFLRPARGMEGLSLKGVASLDAGQGRCGQRADRRDQEAAVKRLPSSSVTAQLRVVFVIDRPP